MVCLVLEPGAAGWKAQTNPLSFAGTQQFHFFAEKKNRNKVGAMFRSFVLIPIIFAAVLGEGAEFQDVEGRFARRAFKVNNPGPLVTPSIGQIWPKPQVQSQDDGTFHTFDVDNFSFEVNFSALIFGRYRISF